MVDGSGAAHRLDRTVPGHVQQPDAHTGHSGLTCGPEAACLGLLGTWKQLMEAFGLRPGARQPEGHVQSPAAQGTQEGLSLVRR